MGSEADWCFELLAGEFIAHPAAGLKDTCGATIATVAFSSKAKGDQ